MIMRNNDYLCDNNSDNDRNNSNKKLGIKIIMTVIIITE